MDLGGWRGAFGAHCGARRLDGKTVTDLDMGTGSPERDDSQLDGLSAAGSRSSVPLVQPCGSVDEHTKPTGCKRDRFGLRTHETVLAPSGRFDKVGQGGFSAKDDSGVY